LKELKYPIGEFSAQESYSRSDLNAFLQKLKDFPDELSKVVSNITDEQLSRPYRPGGWTACQVVHHVADSHMNMLTRLKWTQTEETPEIKAYFEDRWANEADYSLPVEISVNMIRSIHAKVIALLSSYSENELSKQYFHPESKKLWSIKTVMALYAWHGQHHLAHIKICKGEWLL
jgi:hypothetical protein